MTYTLQELIDQFGESEPHRRRKRSAAQARALELRRQTMLQRYGAYTVNCAEIKIKMYVSPWVKDAQGFPTRFIRQVEA
jgi:hypothetical protein